MPSLSSASTTSGPVAAPRRAAAEARDLGADDPARARARPPASSVASSAEVVVLPWVPATATVRPALAQIAARAADAVHAPGAPPRRAATTWGWSVGVAVDTTTASIGGQRSRARRSLIVDAEGAERRRGTGVSSAGSWPLTGWPISARSVAMALMPGAARRW